MTVSTSLATNVPRPAPTGVVTLRALLDARLAQGRHFSLDEATATLVPLCMDLRDRHARGELVYVHPSAIAPGPDGMARLDPRCATAPTHPSDRACLAPEHRGTFQPGNARASVFSVGAILYELVTGEHIGPAMRRPKDIDPTLPDALEALLGKALVGDPAHRPDDLGALASAMHHLAPMKSIPPPVADESRLDHTDSFDVDVRLSMLPPASDAMPAIPPPPRDPFTHVEAPPPPSVQRPSNDPTARLSALKERLESDPRPRYVVNKDRMDHGPFSAVELLQQIASGQFVGEDGLRDEISGQSQPIAEWEEFSQFAQSAAIHREIREEKKAVAAVAEKEKTAGLAKSTLGVAVIVGLLAAGGVFFIVRRGLRSDNVDIEGDKTLSLDPAGSIKGRKIAKRAGPGGGGGPGFAGGMSYEDALNKNVQEINIGGPASGPDLSDAQLQGPINARVPGILGSCGTPGSTKVTIKVAIKMGHAVGVTVITNPPAPGVAGCIDGGVRGIAWPAHPKMDTLVSSW